MSIKSRQKTLVQLELATQYFPHYFWQQSSLTEQYAIKYQPTESHTVAIITYFCLLISRIFLCTLLYFNGSVATPNLLQCSLEENGT